MHSADYRGLADVPGGPVLVVGGGNTGYQIAEELAAAHEVHLSVGSRQTPLPQRLLGRDLFRYLEAGRFMRVTVHSRLGQRLQYRETLIGSSPRAARRRHGIELRGRAVAASGTEIRFADGSELSPKTVIWATGFALDHSFVRAPVFDKKGVSSTAAASPPCPVSTSSACPGSTPAAPRSWGGSRTTRSTSPRRSREPRRGSPSRRPSARPPSPGR
jgi:cation diffusion facilitator CzcD-associated flavoprotein CzcO